uniref:Uncharacterized protein n=1 Tax=Cacopsylla melanoneura TaxID=428564 RepID=A0A8D9E6Z4_9HEMI
MKSDPVHSGMLKSPTIKRLLLVIFSHFSKQSKKDVRVSVFTGGVKYTRQRKKFLVRLLNFIKMESQSGCLNSYRSRRIMSRSGLAAIISPPPVFLLDNWRSLSFLKTL